ncbi:MAG: hypothetical protein GXP49_16880 [Deltaproteobacteria bacterium]|nr:hypothetical protein [Deltaproteobacteria bacterium]
MTAQISKKNLILAGRLLKEAENLRGDLNLGIGGKQDAALRLAAGLAANRITSGNIPVDPELRAVWTASRLLAEELNFSAGMELNDTNLLPEVTRCCMPDMISYLPVPSGPLASLRKALRKRPGLAADLLGQASRLKSVESGKTKVVTATSKGKDKIELISQVLERLPLESMVQAASDRSGKFKEDCLAVIRVYTGPAQLPVDDGLYPDPTLVLKIISSLLEAGIGRVIIGTDGGEAGAVPSCSEPARLFARLGFLDEGLNPIEDINPASPPPAKVLVAGEERDIPIIDLGSDGGRHTWSSADLRVLVASPRVHGADRLALTLHGLVDHKRSKGDPSLARETAVELAASHPVHMAVLEATTGSDGPGGEYSCPRSKLLRTIVASSNPLAVDILSAQILGVNPFKSKMIDLAVKELGLTPYFVDGEVYRIEQWRNKRLAPLLTTRHGITRKILFDVPKTGGNPGKRALDIVLLRPFWAGGARPAAISARLIETKLLKKELEKKGPRAKLSNSDPAFFLLARELPRRDIGLLLSFLKSESETIEAGTGNPRRLGHILRLGDGMLQMRSFSARPVIAATEIVRGVAYGRWNFQTVLEDLRVWEEIHSLSLGTRLSINRFNAPRRRVVPGFRDN